MTHSGAWIDSRSCSGVVLYYLDWNCHKFNPLMWLSVQPDTKHLANKIVDLATKISNLKPVRVDEMHDLLVFYDRSDSPVFKVRICPECACIMGGYHKLSCPYHDIEEIMCD